MHSRNMKIILILLIKTCTENDKLKSQFEGQITYGKYFNMIWFISTAPPRAEQDKLHNEQFQLQPKMMITVLNGQSISHYLS